MTDQGYTRPQLTPEQQADARASVMQFSHRSKAEILAALAMFIVDNARLWLEVNEHRNTLGIDPLPWKLEERR